MLRALIKYFKPDRGKPSLNAVYMKDDETGGYTTFFKEYPSVISQGKTKSEALINLHEDFVAALEMQKKRSERLHPSNEEFAC